MCTRSHLPLLLLLLLHTFPHRYLVHLDGQGLSSRFEQLMPLNSLIFKEESGYSTFYYPLLQPYTHYVPFWKEGPEEILGALEWAQAHDDEARRMAQNAQVGRQLPCLLLCSLLLLTTTNY